MIFSYETVSLVEGLNGTSAIQPVVDPVSNINSSTRRKRHSSSRSAKALHQVLTMEQLGDENKVRECIEMTYIATESEVIDVDDVEIRRDSAKSLEESEEGSSGSSLQTFPVRIRTFRNLKKTVEKQKFLSLTLVFFRIEKNLWTLKNRKPNPKKKTCLLPRNLTTQNQKTTWMKKKRNQKI